MDRPVVAVVLAGGTGTRLYPASRSSRPKQLLSFGGERSLLARTIDRTDFADETYVLTSERYANAISEHAPDAAVLVEPEPKDTGPALVYAAGRIREQVGECVLCCLPSDHHVSGAFEPTARQATRVAADTEGLVTIGVEPTRPATGYGYLELGAERENYHEVARFHEKPDRETAARYLDGNYRWNAGLFAWTPSALLSAARDSPLSSLVDALEDGDPERGFETIDPVSIDYAVLERAEEVFCVPADFAWDDLGTWDALARIAETDDDGNTVLGDALTLGTADSIVATDEDTHVSAVSVENLVIAAYDDRVLVVPTEDTQRVREVVTRLRDEGRF